MSSTSGEPRLIVLVVERDPTIQVLRTRALDRLGYGVVGAVDLASARARLGRSASGKWRAPHPVRPVGALLSWMLAGRDTALCVAAMLERCLPRCGRVVVGGPRSVGPAASGSRPPFHCAIEPDAGCREIGDALSAARAIAVSGHSRPADPSREQLRLAVERFGRTAGRP